MLIYCGVRVLSGRRDSRAKCSASIKPGREQ